MQHAPPPIGGFDEGQIFKFGTIRPKVNLFSSFFINFYKFFSSIFCSQQCPGCGWLSRDATADKKRCTRIYNGYNYNYGTYS